MHIEKQKTISGVEVIANASTGWVDRISLCKAAKKPWDEFLAKGHGGCYLKEIAEQERVSPAQLLVTEGEGVFRREWIHPQLALHFGGWVNGAFAAHVINWVARELFSTHKHNQDTQQHPGRDNPALTPELRAVKQVLRSIAREINEQRQSLERAAGTVKMLGLYVNDIPNLIAERKQEASSPNRKKAIKATSARKKARKAA